MTPKTLLALACASALATPALAQEHDHSGMNHTGMDHSGMDHSSMDMSDEEMAEAAPSASAASEGSGTSLLPANEGMEGLHLPTGNWTLMVHGVGTAAYTDHSGPRGDDKLYVTSMLMLAGERETGWGRIQLRSMMSLEPAMDPAGYPNLFATGETAGGVALVDRQHPHDLFMELAARVDFNLGATTRLFVYGGPVGEPALGPSAFMHRASARYNPEPPITHHWFDSTHITYGVVTAGVTTPLFQIEGSGFRGAEPDERRWNIETPRIDSWSVRATVTPSSSLALQASYGEIHEPEKLHPGEDERRFTLSAQFNDGRGLAALAAFSNKKRDPGKSLTAWLSEVNWDLDRANTLFGRVENVANDELFPDHAHPLHDRTFRVTKFQLGYARRIPIGPFGLALGASGAFYAKPAALDPYYGRNPFGYTVFARFSLGA